MVKIEITGEAREIAALLLAIQEKEAMERDKNLSVRACAGQVREDTCTVGVARSDGTVWGHVEGPVSGTIAAGPEMTMIGHASR